MQFVRRHLSVTSDVSHVYTIFRNSSTAIRSQCETGLKQINSNVKPKPFKSMPCVPAIPILGSQWTMLPFIGKYDKRRFHEALYKKYEEYGTIVREKFQHSNIVWVFDADDAKTLLRNEGKYPRREGFDSMTLYRKLGPQFYSSGDLLTARGEHWSKFRSKTQPYLMRINVVQEYIPVMNKIANEMIERIEKISYQNEGRVDDFDKELILWALESIGVIALDQHFGCLELISNANKKTDENLINLISKIVHYTGKLDFQVFPIWRWLQKPIGDIWSKYIDVSDQFTRIIIQYINEIIETSKSGNNSNREKSCVLKQLLSRPDFSCSEAVSLTVDLFLGGMDTTSHSLAYAVHFLAKNKSVQTKARDEVIRVIGNEKAITAEMINELHYLRACMKESHRLMPVVVITSRILTEEIILSGYKIPVNTMVAIVPYVIGRLEKYYSDPLLYKPERWMQTSFSESSSKRVFNEEIHPFALLPFGHGNRMCIGRRITTQQQLILLSKMLQNYEISYEGDELGMITRNITHPDKKLKFEFKKRH